MNRTASINLMIHALIGFCYSASCLDKSTPDAIAGWADRLITKAKEVESLIETDEWRAAVYTHKSN